MNTKWNIWLFISIVSLFAACASDEVDLTGDIYGKITDSKSGDPVGAVTVTLTPGGKSATTGSDGIFQYSGISAGQYSLQAQKSGYKTNYKQIAIVAGETASGDMSLESVKTEGALDLSTSELVFGSNMTELTFTVKNTGSASASWDVSGLDVAWMTVSPMQGTTKAGEESVVKVTVDRTELTGIVSSTIIVNVPGGSRQVRVTVNP